MAFYSQWVKDKKISQLIWICGTEPILRAEVLDYFRKCTPVSALNFAVLDLESITEAQLWNIINQRTIIDVEERLVVVKNCQHLEDLTPLKEWLAESKNSFPNTHLCFISEDDAPPDVGFLKPPKATVVRCSKLSSEDMVVWVKRNSPLADRSARVLLEHVAGVFEDARVMCAKITAVLPGQSSVVLSSEMLACLLYTSPSPRD